MICDALGDWKMTLRVVCRVTGSLCSVPALDDLQLRPLVFGPQGMIPPTTSINTCAISQLFESFAEVTDNEVGERMEAK